MASIINVQGIDIGYARNFGAQILTLASCPSYDIVTLNILGIGVTNEQIRMKGSVKTD